MHLNITPVLGAGPMMPIYKGTGSWPRFFITLRAQAQEHLGQEPEQAAARESIIVGIIIQTSKNCICFNCMNLN